MVGSLVKRRIDPRDSHTRLRSCLAPWWLLVLVWFCLCLVDRWTLLGQGINT